MNFFSHALSGRRFLTLCLCASVAIGSSGCAPRVKNVTSLPAGVSQKQAQDWDAAVADLHRIATTVSTIRQAVVDVRDAGTFPNDEVYADVLRGLGHMAQLELSAENVLRQSPQNFSQSAKDQVRSYTVQISAEVEKLNAAGVTGIKNPKSVDRVNKLLAELTGVVKLVIALTE